MQELPVKKRMETIREQIGKVRTINSQSKKELLEIENEMRLLENKLQDPFSLVKKYFVLSRHSLQEVLNKESALYEEQVAFLQDQLHQMIDDKVKATQNCLILDQKIRHLTQDIG